MSAARAMSTAATAASSAATAAGATAPAWVADVLNTWFVKWGQAEWFQGGPHIDALCRDQFVPLYEKLAGHTPEEAWTQPRTALATILVFDQFPRNMFRKTARAFATDPQALALSKHAVAKGFDKDMTKWERAFLYMPHVHSENLADQDTAIALFRQGVEDPGSKDHTQEHRDIIARFGRFPHRNAVLGRDSTPEEVDFCATHQGFGQ